MSTKSSVKKADQLFNNILDNYPKSSHKLLNDAYKFAANGHKNQRRKSGEEYITHPLQVALYLAELKLDKETIIAAFLHDLIEDTEITY